MIVQDDEEEVSRFSRLCEFTIPENVACVTYIKIESKIRSSQSLMLTSNYPLDEPREDPFKDRPKWVEEYDYVQMAQDGGEIQGNIAKVREYMKPGSKISVIGLVNEEDDPKSEMVGPVFTIEFDFKKDADLDNEEKKLRQLCE